MEENLTLDLIPDSTQVVLVGPPSQETGQLFTGKLIFTSPGPAKISDLTVSILQNHGSYSEGYYRPDKVRAITKKIIEDGRAVEGGALTFSASGTIRWSFTFIIPGDMPETVYTRERFISYKITANINCTLPWKDSFELPPKPIYIKRMFEVGSEEAVLAQRGISEMSTKEGLAAVMLYGNSSFICDRGRIRFNGFIAQAVAGIKLAAVRFELIENSHTMLYEGFEGRKVSRKIINRERKVNINNVNKSENGISMRTEVPPKPAMDGQAFDLDQVVQFEVDIPLPELYKVVQYETFHGSFRVNHDIRFVATFYDRAANERQIDVTASIFIIPREATELLIQPAHELDNEELLNRSIIPSNNIYPLQSEPARPTNNTSQVEPLQREPAESQHHTANNHLWNTSELDTYTENKGLNDGLPTYVEAVGEFINDSHSSSNNGNTSY